MTGHEVKDHLSSYFRETTVHGFRYVADGRNWYERAVWVVVILSSFTYSAVMVHSSLREAEENPIASNTETVSVSEVPFPAVTVNLGRDYDSWGFLKQGLDTLQVRCGSAGCADEEVKAAQDAIVPYVKRIVYDRFKNEKYQRSFACDLIGVTTLAECRPQKEFAMKQNFYTRYDNLERAGKLLAAFEYMAAANKGTRDEPSRQERDLATVKKLLIENTVDYIVNSADKDEAEFRRSYGRAVIDAVIPESFNASLTDQICGSLSPDGCTDEYNQAYYFLGILLRLVNLEQEWKFGQFIGYYAREDGGTPMANYSKEVAARYLGADDLGTTIEDLVEFLNLPGHYSKAGDEVDIPGCDFEEYLAMWENKTEDTEAPCENEKVPEKVKGCCDLRKKLTGIPDKLLGLMSYSIQRQQPFLTKDRFRKDFGDLSFLGYAQKPGENRSLGTMLYNPRVFHCQFQKAEGQDPQSCNLFSQSFTNEGLAYTFNQGRFWSGIKNNTYNQMLKDAISFENSDTDVRFPASIGPMFSFEAAFLVARVDSKSYTNSIVSPSGSSSRTRRKIKISIHEPGSPADLRYGFVDLVPGFKYTFQIVASQMETSEDVKEYDVARRKCKFTSESEGMEIFSEYTRSGCLLECKLKRARAACGCVPWNYPRPTGAEASASAVCDRGGATCFEEVMFADPTNRECDCPQDCTTTWYTYSVTPSPLPAVFFCDPENDDHTSEYLERFDLIPYILSNAGEDYLSTKRNQSCINRVEKHMVTIEVQYSQDTATRIVRNVRVSFSGMISSLGGTIGLFTGMSILSFMEILFWLARLVNAVDLKRKKGSKNQGVSKEGPPAVSKFSAEAKF